MAKHKFIYNKETCIGCGSCKEESPDFWDMDFDCPDGVKAKQKKAFFDEKTEKENLAARDCCPSGSITTEEVSDEEYEEKKDS